MLDASPQIIDDNVVKFCNVEKPGPTVRAIARSSCLMLAVARCSRELRDTDVLCAYTCMLQELSVSLVENCMKQLKQLKEEKA